jgi:hypothetical protein
MVTSADAQALFGIDTSPRNAAMSLIFTSLGATTSSFISDSKSVPPASGAASSHELPSKRTA